MGIPPPISSFRITLSLLSCYRKYNVTTVFSAGSVLSNDITVIRNGVSSTDFQRIRYSISMLLAYQTPLIAKGFNCNFRRRTRYLMASLNGDNIIFIGNTIRCNPISRRAFNHPCGELFPLTIPRGFYSEFQIARFLRLGTIWRRIACSA